METGRSFWKRLSNPRRFIDDAAEQVIGGGSVVLDFPNGIPWEDILISVLKEKLEDSGTEKRFDEKNASGVTDTGQFLFNKYCSPNDRKNFTPLMDYMEFLAGSKNTVLGTTIVFVSGITSETVRSWTESAEKYHRALKGEANHGSLILINSGTSDTKNGAVKNLVFSDYVTEYDSLMLCLTLVSDLKIHSKEKQYIADFANILSGGNIELGGALAENGEHLIKDPLHTVQNVFKEMHTPYTNLSKLVDSAMWEAQTKLVFPIVESYRKSFIEKYEGVLRNYIPFKDNFTGEKIKDVYELQIGHLYALAAANRFADYQEFVSLAFMRSARNDSSHWNVIDFERFRKLINY